jgi:hypothetical protein
VPNASTRLNDSPMQHNLSFSTSHLSPVCVQLGLIGTFRADYLTVSCSVRELALELYYRTSTTVKTPRSKQSGFFREHNAAPQQRWWWLPEKEVVVSTPNDSTVDCLTHFPITTLPL